MADRQPAATRWSCRTSWFDQRFVPGHRSTSSTRPARSWCPSRSSCRGATSWPPPWSAGCSAGRARPAGRRRAAFLPTRRRSSCPCRSSDDGRRRDPAERQRRSPDCPTTAAAGWSPSSAWTLRQVPGDRRGSGSPIDGEPVTPARRATVTSASTTGPSTTRPASRRRRRCCSACATGGWSTASRTRSPRPAGRSGERGPRARARSRWTCDGLGGGRGRRPTGPALAACADVGRPDGQAAGRSSRRHRPAAARVGLRRPAVDRRPTRRPAPGSPTGTAASPRPVRVPGRQRPARSRRSLVSPRRHPVRRRGPRRRRRRGCVVGRIRSTARAGWSGSGAAAAAIRVEGADRARISTSPGLADVGRRAADRRPGTCRCFEVRTVAVDGAPAAAEALPTSVSGRVGGARGLARRATDRRPASPGPELLVDLDTGAAHRRSPTGRVTSIATSASAVAPQAAPARGCSTAAARRCSADPDAARRPRSTCCSAAAASAAGGPAGCCAAAAPATPAGRRVPAWPIPAPPGLAPPFAGRGVRRPGAGRWCWRTRSAASSPWPRPLGAARSPARSPRPLAGRRPGRSCWSRCRRARRACAARGHDPAADHRVAAAACCGRATGTRRAAPLLRLRAGGARTRPASTPRSGRANLAGSMRCPAGRCARLAAGGRAPSRGLRRRADHRRHRARGPAGAGGRRAWGRRDRGRGGDPPTVARRNGEFRGHAFRRDRGRTNVCAWSPSGSVVASSRERLDPIRGAIRPGKPMPVAGETAHVSRGPRCARDHGAA